MSMSSVTVYAVNSDGSNGTTLGSTTTDLSGNFSVNIPPHSGPVRLTASGGSYVSEMNGVTISSPASISALLADGSSSVSGISINPLSDFVNSQTLYILSQTVPFASALSQAESQVETAYGITTNPATLTPDYTAADVNTDAAKLGLVIGALINEDQQLCPGTPGALVTALSADFADNQFNGRQGSNPVSYCGNPLPAIAGSADFIDALSGPFQSQLVGLAFAFGGTFGPTGNVLMNQTPPVTPNLLVSPLGSIIEGLANTVIDVNQETADLFAAPPSAPTVGPKMVSPREQASASLLPNGQVLIAGGLISQVINGTTNVLILNTTELYNGTSFSAGPNMTESRASQVATTLPGGNVLLVGPDSTGEVYLWQSSPSPSFAAATNSMAYRRGLPTTTVLPNDLVLIAGGEGEPATDNNPADFHALATTDLYDIATNSFQTSNTPLMGTHRYAHTATLLPNGKVLIAGGVDNSETGQFNILKSTELYDPVANTFTPGPNMNTARFNASAAVYGGNKVLIIGGEVSAGTNEFTPTSSIEIYDCATNTFETSTPSMTKPHVPIATLLPSGAVLVVDNNGGQSMDFFESPVELYSGMFTPYPPSLGLGRQYETVTVLQNGKVLVAGGLPLVGGLSSGIEETNTTEIITP
jgi:hypothetical protein